MTASRPPDGSVAPRTTVPALVRAAALLGLWVLLIGAAPADLVAGAVTAGAAAWVSLRLLPAGGWRLRPAALAGLAGRLLRQAAVAGADVAWRAFHPALPLRPGVVSHRLRLAPGPGRDAFRVLASLLPGTVAVGLEPDGALRIHCLDVGQPVAAQLAADEARLARALGDGGAQGDG